jgi:hypothetical protein
MEAAFCIDGANGVHFKRKNRPDHFWHDAIFVKYLTLPEASVILSPGRKT